MTAADRSAFASAGWISHSQDCAEDAHHNERACVLCSGTEARFVVTGY
ncbi:MAG TPA: hypothetical protein VMW56_17720 [Candidatus Margulisiibacteriota bacterium]|nr:hypothetical protein [Candidatus Margulisiibacteriota bacterium]